MTEPVIERHPFGYPWRRRFPAAERVLAYEGGAVYSADAEGAFWVIRDEGTLADFLDPTEDADLLAQLIVLERYSERAKRDAAMSIARDRATARASRRRRGDDGDPLAEADSLFARPLPSPPIGWGGWRPSGGSAASHPDRTVQGMRRSAGVAGVILAVALILTYPPIFEAFAPD